MEQRALLNNSQIDDGNTIQDIVTWCVRRQLAVPVLFFLEAHRPLRGVMAFSAQFISPLLPGVFDKFAKILEDPDAVDLLIVKLRRADGD